MIIKAYSNKELAQHYKVPYKSWLKWVKKVKNKHADELGEVLRGLWTPAQVEIIVRHLGLPQKELLE